MGKARRDGEEVTRPGTRGSTSEEAPVMGVELREPGRWIRDKRNEGINTVDSAEYG